MSFLMVVALLIVVAKISSRSGGGRNSLHQRMQDLEDHLLDRVDGLEIAVRNLTERLHEVESRKPQKIAPPEDPSPDASERISPPGDSAE